MVALRLALLYLPFLVTIFLTATTTAQPNFISLSCGYVKGGNSSGSSTYISNLNSLLLNITSDTRIDYGFFNFSSSSGSSSSSNSDEKVNVVALCRGDVSVQDCRSCLSNAATLLPRSCSNQKEAIGWYDNCMLRYSNRTIFRTVETSPHFYLWNTEDALEINNFKAVLAEMLRRLRIAASSGNWRRKYATTNATAPRNQTIYGLVQCTPDLSMDDCDTCLGGAISELPKCCNRSKGGRVVRPSCNIRYESYSFFGTPQEAVPPLPPSPPPPPPQSAPPPTNSSMFQQGKSKSTTRRTIIVIVVPILGFIFLLILIFIYLRLKKPRKYIEGEAHEEIITADSLQFDFESIKVATNDFSEANKLGQGGFGLVYKGRLFNEQEIAVKRLSRDSGQGDREFKNEVLLVAKLQHRNLVKLLGFCLENRERLLVYEFVPNKSLDYFLFDPLKRVQLNWERRYKIIEGIARGLLYLHQDSRVRIVHRDLKASNILLNEEMIPKISDFGMARLFGVDQTQDSTTTIVGTYGYMAPEYIQHGRFSVKSDVFSFGVLILEILSGQKNCEFRCGENAAHLLTAAWKNWREGTISKFLDPMLIEEDSRDEITKCIYIALLCVQENEGERPSMSSIVPMLDSYTLTLSIPSEPAFYMSSTTNTARGDSEEKSSINEVSITEDYLR